MNGRKRTVQIKFRVTEAERDLILEKMKLIPTDNMAAYLRKIAIDGYIIQVDHTDIKAMTAEIQKIGVNVNQIAKRANAPAAVARIAPVQSAGGMDDADAVRVGRVARPRGQVPAPHVHGRGDVPILPAQRVGPQGDLVHGGSVIGHSVVGGQVAFPIEERGPVCALRNQRVEERPIQFPTQRGFPPVVAVLFIECPEKNRLRGQTEGSRSDVLEFDPLHAAIQEVRALRQFRKFLHGRCPPFEIPV